MFDEISGHHGPAKLTHKINHHISSAPNFVFYYAVFLCLRVFMGLAGRRCLELSVLHRQDRYQQETGVLEDKYLSSPPTGG